MRNKIIALTIIIPPLSYASEPEVISPIRYDLHGMPFVDLTINGRIHSMQVDTGSREGLHIYDYQLNKIIASPDTKVLKKTESVSMDITGRKSHANKYLIKNIKISGVNFYNVEMINFVPWGYSKNGEPPPSEVIGLGLFSKKIVSLDFKGNHLSLLKNLPFKTNGWSTNRWSKYNFSLTSSGVVIGATSNGNKYKLVVDTGASNSILFSKATHKPLTDGGCSKISSSLNDSECSVSKLKIKDTDNYQRSTYAIVVDVNDTNNQLDFDGLIGMDILKDHKVIFDMPSRHLYISRY